jgi:hypothetical protein
MQTESAALAFSIVPSKDARRSHIAVASDNDSSTFSEADSYYSATESDVPELMCSPDMNAKKKRNVSFFETVLVCATYSSKSYGKNSFNISNRAINSIPDRSSIAVDELTYDDLIEMRDFLLEMRRCK